MIKRAALALALVFGFLVGYGAAVKAWPGVPDRAVHHGYFSDINDTQGDQVIQNGYPAWVVDANSFISFIKSKLYSGSARDQTGAAFTILTMLGAPWSRNRPPSANEVSDWESRVREAANYGRVTWNMNYSFSVNSYWQGNNGGGSDPNDDAFYYQNATKLSIVFRNASGAIVYAIKRDCGNPVMNGSFPGLPADWAATGSTVLDYGTATPGQTVHFWHYIWNYGLTDADIWWVPIDGPSSAPTGLSSPNQQTHVPAQQNLNVYTDTFTIPNNAAAGTKYCRLIGWDPTNSSGGRNGRGAETCVTVTIPAKLKAAIYPAPSTMSAGDTVTFNPSIAASNNASPVNGVTCMQTLQVLAPGGGVISTNSVPCTDQSGNASFTVPTGASVPLRTNTYTAPNTTPVGTKICQTLVITNPTQPAYFNSYPADTTSTACAIVAKSPYVHFLGGDVWAGGGFASVAPACNTSAKIGGVTRAHALSDGSVPGSGVAYAAFALNRITNFGSASMALQPTIGVGDAWTFSNINPGNLGFYGAPRHCITDYVGLFTATTPMAGGANIDVTTQGSGVWHVTGGLTIHGLMPDGARQVYIVDGDVDITSDLTYKPNFSSGAAIPSLIVISKHNVHVWSATNQIDGIIEAIGNGTTSGVFYTCWPRPAQATTSTCPNTLTVNGSVLAGGLDLFRTAGAEGASPAQQKQPSEIFNLGPEVYINNALGGANQTTLTINSVRELPPRF